MGDIAGDDILSIVTVSVTYIIIFFLPWLIGNRAKHRELMRKELLDSQSLIIAETELAQRNRDLLVARNIHDSITNDLSYISMVLFEGSLLHDDELVARAPALFDDIEKRIKASLKEIHRVINILEVTDNTAVTSPALDFTDEIRHIVAARDADMARVLIEGTSTISLPQDPKLTPTEPTIDMVTALINEVYANLIRHCTPSKDTYSLSIALAPDGQTLIVREENSVFKENGNARGGFSQKGLGLHKRIIENFGGSLITSSVKGAWILESRIPLKATAMVQ